MAIRNRLIEYLSINSKSFEFKHQKMLQQLDDGLNEAEELIQSIQSNFSQFNSSNYDEKKNLGRTIENKLSQLNTKISKLTTMCNSIPEGERDFYVEEINQNLRPTYNRMMTDLRQKMQSMENDPGYKQNQQLHKNLDKQGLILDDLDQAISIGNETKQTADQTMTTLQEDRKILNNVNSNLDDIQTEGKKGQSIANKMLRRIIFNKFVLWTVVVILLALLAFTIYWKLRVVYALNVRINSATGLSANSTTYCVLSYKGQTRQTENAAGASPVWSEIMKFNNVGKDTLGIEVFDNSVSLGSASVDINNYETGVASNGIASVGNTVNISYSIHYCNTKNTPFA